MKKKCSILKRDAVRALISLAALISVATSNACAQDANSETLRKSVTTASLGIIPQQAKDSITDSENEGDILTAQTYGRQGVTYAENGQYDLAISEFNKALKIVPSSPELYNNRGITYSKAGQYDLAVSDFTKALELNPDSTKAYYNRSIIYAIKNQLKLAFMDLNKVLEIDPLYQAAYELRGSMYVVLACSDWQKTCRLGDCEHFKQATTAGLCTETNEDAK